MYNQLKQILSKTYQKDVKKLLAMVLLAGVLFMSFGSMAAIASAPDEVSSAPAELTAAPGDSQIFLSWRASGEAAGYNVKRAIVSGGPYTTVGSTVADTYVDSGLTNGTAYYYVVSAVNAGGESDNSSQTGATPVSINNTHGGDWSMRAVLPATASFSSANQIVNGVAGNTTYEASLWIKGTGSISLSVRNGSWGTNIVSMRCNATSTWTKFTLPSFNTGSNTQLTFLIADSYSTAGTVYIEDAFLGVSRGTNLLGNPGFENGSSSWTYGPGTIWTINQFGLNMFPVKDHHTFYVSPDGDHGAMTSIRQAVTSAGVGSTVIVKDGVYNEEEIIMYNSGAVNDYITLKAEGSSAVIHGNIKVNGSYVRVEGFTLDGENINRGTPLVAGILVNAPYAQIVGNSVKNYFGYGIKCELISGSVVPNAYIAGNYVYNCMAAFQVGDNSIVERNEVEKISMHNTNEAEGDFCRVFGSNIIIRYNYLHGTTLADLYRPSYPADPAHADVFQSWDDVRINVKNILIENNIFLGFYHQGLMLENDKYGPTGTYYISDWTIRNNLFGGVGASGVFSGKPGGGTPNMIFENNTFTGAITNGVQAYYGINMVGTGGSALIRNNILVGFSAASYAGTDGSTVTADYNLIYNGNTPINPGAHDIIGMDPKFVNFNPNATETGLLGNDWHLSPSSPAIDTGCDLSFNTDLEDKARPNGVGFDIGAFEFDGKRGNVAPIVKFTDMPGSSIIDQGSIITLNVDARDSDGIYKVELYGDDVKLAEDDTAPYQFTYAVKRGYQVVKAVAYENTRSTSPGGTRLSSEAKIIIIGGSSENYVYARAEWSNTPIAEQNGIFVAEYDVVPVTATANCVVGMGQGQINAYSKMSAIVRLSPAGVIDVFNTNRYEVLSNVPYISGKMYHIKMVVDVPNKKYSVYVTPDGEQPIKIAEDYGFRASATALNNWAAYAEAGNAYIFGFTVHPFEE